MAEKLKNYINGKWVEPKTDNYLDVVNPSTAKVINKVPLSKAADVGLATISAGEAFKSWSATPVSKRSEYFFKLRDLVAENEKKLTRIICEENGKSIPDALAEIKRMRQNIEVACGMPMLMKGEKLTEVAAGIDTESIKLPMGIFAMIAPFNFPAMVPFWFLPYAVAAGNTYILKPSEQVPNTQKFIFQLIDEAGFPPGVINLVNGDGEVAEALIEHPDIKGISFVGSTNRAHKVLQDCAKHSKRCQSMGGAKNYLVVMPDANLKEAVRNMLTSCFGCSGQRCMAASVIACVGKDTYKRTREAFVEAADKLIVGDPLDPRYKDEEVLMGPIISSQAKQRILKAVKDAKKEGCSILLDKSGIKINGREDGFFLGPVVLGNVGAGSKTERTEIFGPVVSMMEVGSLDKVLSYLEDNPYGNGASIYTQNGNWAREFELRAQCGMIGINLGVPAPVAYFPFGGMKESQLSDIKAQAGRVVGFFTEEKMVTRRFFD